MPQHGKKYRAAAEKRSVDAKVPARQALTFVKEHAYAKFDCDPAEFIDKFHCNHIHGVYGDYVEELRIFCDIKGIEFELLD